MKKTKNKHVESEEDENTLFVFYTINENSKIKTWKYGKFPKSWWWVGSGTTSPIGGKTISSYLIEEQFNGSKDTQNKMKIYLTNLYDKLKEQKIITKYKIRKSYKP